MSAASKSKVNEFDITLLVKDDVFRFDVPVTDAQCFKVEQSIQYLLKHLSSVFFRKWSIFSNFVKKLSSRTILHNHVNFIGSSHHFVELCNIGVHNLLLQANLQVDALELFGVEVVEDHNFDGDLLTCGFVDGSVDIGESSLTDLFH